MFYFNRFKSVRLSRPFYFRMLRVLFSNLVQYKRMVMPIILPTTLLNCAWTFEQHYVHFFFAHKHASTTLNGAVAVDFETIPLYNKIILESATSKEVRKVTNEHVLHKKQINVLGRSEAVPIKIYGS